MPLKDLLLRMIYQNTWVNRTSLHSSDLFLGLYSARTPFRPCLKRPVRLFHGSLQMKARLAEVQDPQAPLHSQSDRSSRPKLTINTTTEMICECLSSTGKGVCKTEGFVVFVPRAKPGEWLDVCIDKINKSFAEGRKVLTTKESQLAVEPKCQHFHSCGGCSHQDLSYDAQLKEKSNWIQNAYMRLLPVTYKDKLPNLEEVVQPIVPCDTIYNYRNKMTFTVQNRDCLAEDKENMEIAKIGLFSIDSSKDNNDVVNIDNCELQHPRANKMLQFLKNQIRTLENKAKIAVQKIVIRQGVKDNKNAFMVLFHTASKDKSVPTNKQVHEDYKALVNSLHREFAELSMIYEQRKSFWKRDKGWTKLTKLSGGDWQQIMVNDLNFRVPPLGFFQVNTEQAGKLVQMVFKAAGLQEGDKVTDLYCGVGLLGLSCAYIAQRQGKPLAELQATDENRDCTTMLKSNYKVFELLKTKLTIVPQNLNQSIAKMSIFTDIVICDPDRNGLSPLVIRWLLESRARTIVYVSCDVATQARDVGSLCCLENPHPYILEEVQGLDMFPHTSHVESIAVLRRPKKGAEIQAQYKKGA